MDQIEKLNELTTLLEAQNNKVKELIEDLSQQVEKRPSVKPQEMEVKTGDDGTLGLKVTMDRMIIGRIRITQNRNNISLALEPNQVPDLIKALKELSGVE